MALIVAKGELGVTGQLGLRPLVGLFLNKHGHTDPKPVFARPRDAAPRLGGEGALGPVRSVRLTIVVAEEREEGMDMILWGALRPEKIAHYKLVCSSYAHALPNVDLPEITLTQGQGEALKRMATLLARGRAVSVSEPSVIGDEESRKDFQIEESFRILTQLRALSIALALVHKRQEVTEHEIELVRRVVLSTLPLNRASVLTLFQNPENLTPEGGFPTAHLARDHQPRVNANAYLKGVR
jgi:hypothetical protein